jgi:hypothetical protein
LTLCGRFIRLDGNFEQTSQGGCRLQLDSAKITKLTEAKLVEEFCTENCEPLLMGTVSGKMWYVRKCIMVDKIQFRGMLYKAQTPVQINNPNKNMLFENLCQV